MADTKPKYVVLKTADWKRVQKEAAALFNAHPEKPGEASSAAITIASWDRDLTVLDAEVIRHQDITSGPIFHLYSNIINTFVDLVSGDTAYDDAGELEHVNPDTLRTIADYFHDMGLMADEERRAGRAKLPD
jgi:hypothetical protein